MKPQKLRLIFYLIEILLTVIIYHASFFFLNYWLIFFNSIVELAIPIGIPTKGAKAEMETHPVIVEIAISECSI